VRLQPHGNALGTYSLARCGAAESRWYLRGDEEVGALEAVLRNVRIEYATDGGLVVVVVCCVDANPAGS
jgi:hypothetical protein